MRKIVTTTFVTLDGVMQAPGGPEEDTSGGFKYGGWSFHYWDELSGSVMDGFMNLPFELLLGRRTYDIFAAYWPTATNAPGIAEPFNRTKKYVVSRSERNLTWHNSTLITGNVETEISKLKAMDGPDLWVHGSGKLIQTLLQHQMIDRMHVWVCPLILGKGKRLFTDDVPAQGLKLIDSKITKKGVIIITYEPAGPVKPGSFVD